MSRLKWRSARHRSAIVRQGLSKPARQALVDRVISPGMSILDYGSGRGLDVGRLRGMGYDVVGWDPFYDDHSSPRPRDLVLLLYVLNVIEDAEERRRTLETAWRLCTRALVVSSRLTWERRKVSGSQYEDGVVTSRGTFQHLYAPVELRSFVEEVTGVRCVVAVPGVVYAFRRDVDRLQVVARRLVPDVEWMSFADSVQALAAVVDFTERRGRLPELEEIPEALTELLGHLTMRELRSAVEKSADAGKVREGSRRSTLDTLLFLGIELFNGRGRFSLLPIAVQVNIRRFFSSYREACHRADRLLLKLRDDTYVRGAMRNSVVGKLTPTALYVHRRAVNRMPVVLRLYEHCGAVAAGRPTEWDVVKLHHAGRKVSWLGYPEFDSNPHPRLAWSYAVDLAKLDTSFWSFAERTNRPLLHRKHEFLAPDDPHSAKYRRLTDSEIRAGLYDNPHLIGTEQGWEAELQRCEVTLRGHRLVRVR